MKIFAFIFARGGSKGLKNKNLKVFDGETLVGRTINQAKKSKLFKKVILSSDSNKILTEGKKKNIFTIKRPNRLATSKSPEMYAWIHAIKFLKKKKLEFDLMVILPCTSPLRNIIDIKRCINSYNNKIHMVMTIVKSKYHPSLNIVKLVSKNEIKKLDNKNKEFLMRQDVQKNFIIANSVYVCNPENILKRSSIFYKKVLGVEVPKERAIDIDDNIDLKISKALAKC
mgnify:CR=1 FL=1|tara:strand:+ start:11579 stop:12259 length:681 start_codon:yes stop_codon:yes gene_type:complete